LERFARIGPRLAAFIVIAGGAVLALVLVHRGAIDPMAIRNMIAGHPAAPLLFIVFQVIASLVVFIPRTILGIAAGLMFGFGWGAVWAILGAEAGAAAGFALWRWIGAGNFDLDSVAGLRPIVERAEKGGWRAVAITRLVPAPHGIVNAALAYTKVRWGAYLAGSLVGMLPMTLVQVDIGAAGGNAVEGGGRWLIWCLLLALGLAGSFLIKRIASRRL
jgi:uncharacterized membrane protein YdjX (TVP38/TMEM64 family)